MLRFYLVFKECIYFHLIFYDATLFTKRPIYAPFINWIIIGWFTEGNTYGTKCKGL